MSRDNGTSQTAQVTHPSQNLSCDAAGSRDGAPQELITGTEPKSSRPIPSLAKSEVNLKEHEGVEQAGIRPLCPRVNCPEKIVICVDVASDMSEPTFRAKAGTRFTPLDIVKKALRLFLYNKASIDVRHEYALVLLVDKALWVHDFTSDVNEIMTYISKSCSVGTFTEFDMDSLFETLMEKAQLPLGEGLQAVDSMPPPFVLRTIFIYGRSYCRPKHCIGRAHEVITKSPHCFFDAVYLHLPPTEENQSEDIYEEICKLDSNGLSYVYEVSRNPTKVFDCLGHLLAHPLQRPIQSLCNYRLEPSLSSAATSN